RRSAPCSRRCAGWWILSSCRRGTRARNPDSNSAPAGGGCPGLPVWRRTFFALAPSKPLERPTPGVDPMKFSAVVRVLAMAMAVAVGVCRPAMAQDPSSSSSSGQGSSAQSSTNPQSDKDMHSGRHHGDHDAGMKSGAMGGKNLLQHLAMTNQMEIDMAQMAEQKASNQQVKDFARTLQQDHSKAQDLVQQAAQKQNVSIAAPGADDKGSKKPMMAQKMGNLSGDQFDKEFIRHQLMDHKREVAQLQKIADNGSDPDTKQLAQQLLPDMQKHLQMAQQIAPQVGVTVAQNGKGGE